MGFRERGGPEMKMIPRSVDRPRWSDKTGFVFLILLYLSVVSSLSAEPIDFVTAHENGQVELHLIGDGVKTSRTQLMIKNLSDESLELKLVAGTVFEWEGRQSLALTADKALTIAPRKAVKTTQPTICVGKPSEEPATAVATKYTPSHQTDVQKRLSRLLTNTKAAKSGNALPALPVPPALEVPVVVQLAYWRAMNYLSKDALKAELLVQMNLTEPTAEQNKELDIATQNFWEATTRALKEN